MIDVLRRVRDGTLSLPAAAKLLRADRIERVGAELTLDLGRHVRTGVPEIVLAEGKKDADVRSAALTFVRATGRAIVTRLDRTIAWGRLPGVAMERHPGARILVLRRRGHSIEPTGGRVAVLTAGASDRAIADEVEVVAREMGCEVRSVRDVGVAGLTRVLDALTTLEPWDPHAYVVLAGREGALAPVVAGLVPGPVIAVPVSTGYGYRGRGEAALSTMLQSCAPLVTVNIDGGVIAGAVAAQVANRCAAEATARTSTRRGGPRRRR